MSATPFLDSVSEDDIAAAERIYHSAISQSEAPDGGCRLGVLLVAAAQMVKGAAHVTGTSEADALELLNIIMGELEPTVDAPNSEDMQ